MFTSNQTNKIALVLGSMIWLTGCASTPGTDVAVVQPRDIETFKVRCDQKAAQIQFLETNLQAVRRSPVSPNMFERTSNRPGDPTNSMTQQQHINSGWTEGLIRRHLYMLRTYCP
jgi:hypothetical protein